MIHLAIDQGSAEWYEARAGIPTASAVHRLLTPAKQVYSIAGANSYRCELLAEWLLGDPNDGPDSYLSKWTDRGSALEGDATFWYQGVTDAQLHAGGFCLRNDRQFGGSPDALIRDEQGRISGGLEVKCPKASECIAHLIGERPHAHLAQCQAAIYLCEVDWWDLLVFNPELPESLVRVERDDKYIAKLDAALARFGEFLDHGKTELTRRGYAPKEDAER